MPTLHHILRISAVSLLALSLSCGGEASIPLFEFGFIGTTSGNACVEMFFGPEKPTAESGTFEFANMNVAGVQRSYTGTWSSDTFDISTDAAVGDPIATRYRGTFVGENTIELHPMSGVDLPPIILQRKNSDGTPSC